MTNTQLIDAINNARLTESEKRTAVAALKTAERLVGVVDWIQGALGGVGRAVAVKSALRA